MGIYLAFGLKTLLLVYLPIQYFAGMVGIFLFYVQHHFEDAYWEHDPRWEYLKAAMEGSTYLKLPKASSGSPATSASTTSTTWPPRSPTTTCPRCRRRWTW